ncbi:S-adenosyl-L-methionine-dependent methyltransferase [Aspergillus pseudoustus]|uniref:S-adenosyl-L-methionine-dependent methyltransferase n=1 Tax=Aspergillus pseudoustus TaxID=1810923 RepID=A0ABR4KYE4_9EURO
MAEKTFRSYTAEQGKTYVQNRLDYHPNLYNTVLTHHTSTGGKLDLLLDIGCGPGLAIANLAPHFSQAIGLDPSEGMIATARSRIPDLPTTAAGKPIRFEVSTAEELGRSLTPAVADGSVDLIVVATAAHWFDMPAFWAAAARVLKPSGTVAIWASGHMEVHPDMPNAAAIQEVMDKIEVEYVQQHFIQGNWLTRERYQNLGLPWTVEPKVRGFDEASFVRKDWDARDEDFYAVGQPEADLDAFERMIGTGSPITRWRQANPELVGTEKDVVRIFRREIERLLREAGVKEGEERVRGATTGFLLMVKREA